MPRPRNYLASIDGTEGIGFSHPVPLPPAYRAVQIVSARDLACPECPAGPGEDCTTGRMSSGKHPLPLLCPGRIELARSLRDQGELSEQARPVECTPVSTERMRHQKKLGDQDRADIVRKHAAGMTLSQLGRQYGVAPTSIKYVLKRAGVI